MNDRMDRMNDSMNRMNDGMDKAAKAAELTDETLDKVAGGAIRPFNPEGICNECKAELGGSYHVVTECGSKFYLCDGCYEKYKAGELRMFKSLTYDQ